MLLLLFLFMRDNFNLTLKDTNEHFNSYYLIAICNYEIIFSFKTIFRVASSFLLLLLSMKKNNIIIKNKFLSILIYIFFNIIIISECVCVYVCLYGLISISPYVYEREKERARDFEKKCSNLETSYK